LDFGARSYHLSTGWVELGREVLGKVTDNHASNDKIQLVFADLNGAIKYSFRGGKKQTWSTIAFHTIDGRKGANSMKSANDWEKNRDDWSSDDDQKCAIKMPSVLGARPSMARHTA